jgi:hypothetical protein
MSERPKPTMLEQAELMRMLFRDIAYEFAAAIRWRALAAALDCPLCHLLGEAKTGPCPDCRPAAASLALIRRPS